MSKESDEPVIDGETFAASESLIDDLNNFLSEKQVDPAVATVALAYLMCIGSTMCEAPKSYVVSMISQMYDLVDGASKNTPSNVVPLRPTKLSN